MNQENNNHYRPITQEEIDRCRKWLQQGRDDPNPPPPIFPANPSIVDQVKTLLPNKRAR